MSYRSFATRALIAGAMSLSCAAALAQVGGQVRKPKKQNGAQQGGQAKKQGGGQQGGQAGQQGGQARKQGGGQQGGQARQQGGQAKKQGGGQQGGQAGQQGAARQGGGQQAGQQGAGQQAGQQGGQRPGQAAQQGAGQPGGQAFQQGGGQQGRPKGRQSVQPADYGRVDPQTAPVAVTTKKLGLAIKRGIDRLLEDQQEDGSWSYGADEDRALGMTALATLALHENGVPVSATPMRAALRYVRSDARANTDTYSVSLATALLARIGNRQDRPLVRLLAARLVAAQEPTGAWGYECPLLSAERDRDEDAGALPGIGMGDLSVTQFAVLALWQAQRVGARVDKAFRLVRQRLAWSQTKDGGWNYYGIPDMNDSPSMTAAGTFMWVVSSAWEVQDAKQRGIEQVVAREPRPQPESRREKARRRLEKKEGMTASKIQEALAKIKDRPADIYHALKISVPSRKRAATKGRNGSFAAVNKIGPLDYEYPDTLPPTLDATSGSPLADDEVLKKAVERVGFWADQNKLSSATLYYPWSVERLGVLLAVDVFGKTDWFKEGAGRMLARQFEDGSWGIGQDDGAKATYKYGPDTCFALLFLRQANLGSSVTRMLNPDSDQPFLIAGREDARFATLAEAIRSAKEGDEIVIRGDGPFPVAGLAIDKPIRIRAEQGYDPVFFHKRPDDRLGFAVDLKDAPQTRWMFVLGEGRITMEGLRLRMDPSSREEADWAAIRCNGTELLLLNCTLSMSAKRRATGVELVDAKRVFLRNTMFLGLTQALDIQSSGRCNVALRDCLAYGPSTVRASGAGGLNLWLIENTLQATRMFDFGTIKGTVNVLAENNVLRARELFADLGSGERTWDGRMNLFDNNLWVVKGPAGAKAIDGLAKWKRFFGTSEHRSNDQMPAPFAVARRQQVGSIRHNVSPLDWTLNEDLIRNTMRAGVEDQVGVNVYMAGAGQGYLQFRDSAAYADWVSVDLPSERTVAASDAD